MTQNENRPPPVVCTLDTTQRSARKVEWSDLGGLARSTEVIPGGIASTFALSLAEAIEDLADREQSCCGSWLDIAVSRSADGLRLELTTTNPDGLAMIHTMAGSTR